MEIKIKKPEVLNKIIKYCSQLNEECEVKFDIDKLYIRALHKSNVMLSNIIIDKKLFDDYKVEEKVTTTFNFEIFTKICNSMKKGFILTDNQTEFIITSLDGKTTRGIKKYVLPEDERTDPPHSNNIISVDYDALMDALSDSLQVDEVIQIDINENRFVIRNKGNLETFESILDGKSDENINLFISSKFFANAMALSGMNKKIDLYLAQTSPFYFEITGENIFIKTWIAPRMENENDNTNN